MELEELKQKAEELAGREVTVQQLTDGKYIAEWFSFQHAPPPSADTEENAYKVFIDYMNTLKEKNNDTEDDRA